MLSMDCSKGGTNELVLWSLLLVFVVSRLFFELFVFVVFCSLLLLCSSCLIWRRGLGRVVSRELKGEVDAVLIFSRDSGTP